MFCLVSTCWSQWKAGAAYGCCGYLLSLKQILFASIYLKTGDTPLWSTCNLTFVVTEMFTNTEMHIYLYEKQYELLRHHPTTFYFQLKTKTS